MHGTIPHKYTPTYTDKSTDTNTPFETAGMHIHVWSMYGYGREYELHLAD